MRWWWALNEALRQMHEAQGNGRGRRELNPDFEMPDEDEDESSDE